MALDTDLNELEQRAEDAKRRAEKVLEDAKTARRLRDQAEDEMDNTSSSIFGL